MPLLAHLGQGDVARRHGVVEEPRAEGQLADGPLPRGTCEPGFDTLCKLNCEF